MSSNASSKPNSYWRELGLVVLGAVIGLTSSLAAAYIQAESQQDQFWLDKKIGIIRDYSAAVNQGIFVGRAKLRVAHEKLGVMIDELSEGRYPSMADQEEFMKASNAFGQEADSLVASVLVQRTLVYAFFRDKPPDLKLDLEDLNDHELVAQFKHKYRAARNERERRSAMIELYANYSSQIAELDRKLIDALNKVNEDILTLAKRARLN